MSQGAQDFVNKVCEDKHLRKQLMEYYQRKQSNAIEKLAAQCGYPCTYQEIVHCFQQNGLNHENVTEKELEKIVTKKTKESN
jgi:predicted ribosomally synthesized peptide with nif11-like leader